MTSSDGSSRPGTPSGDPDTATRGLPALGHRGGGWVSIQLGLFGGALAAGLLGAPWPAFVHRWLVVAGGLVLLAGLVLLLGAGVGLGRQLTPFPRPVAGGTLRHDGVYAMVRHPMYGAVLTMMLGWALVSSPLTMVPLGLTAVFLDAKSRREELWLVERHPDYCTYRQQVPHRFLPRLW